MKWNILAKIYWWRFHRALSIYHWLRRFMDSHTVANVFCNKLRYCETSELKRAIGYLQRQVNCNFVICYAIVICIRYWSSVTYAVHSQLLAFAWHELKNFPTNNVYFYWFRLAYDRKFYKARFLINSNWNNTWNGQGFSPYSLWNCTWSVIALYTWKYHHYL